jgi:hypothetical protein
MWYFIIGSIFAVIAFLVFLFIRALSFYCQTIDLSDFSWDNTIDDGPPWEVLGVLIILALLFAWPLCITFGIFILISTKLGPVIDSLQIKKKEDADE